MRHITTFKMTELGREYDIPGFPGYTLLYNNRNPQEQPEVVSRRYCPVKQDSGPRILKGDLKDNERRQYNLGLSGGIQQQIRLEALVCTTFHGPRPEGLVVCHDDDKPMNNRPGNVYWGTEEVNNKQAAPRRAATIRRIRANPIPIEKVAAIKWAILHEREAYGGVEAIARAFEVSTRWVRYLAAGRRHADVVAAPAQEHKPEAA